MDQLAGKLNKYILPLTTHSMQSAANCKQLSVSHSILADSHRFEIAHVYYFLNSRRMDFLM